MQSAIDDTDIQILQIRSRTAREAKERSVQVMGYRDYFLEGNVRANSLSLSFSFPFGNINDDGIIL